MCLFFKELKKAEEDGMVICENKSQKKGKQGKFAIFKIQFYSFNWYVKTYFYRKTHYWRGRDKQNSQWFLV